MEYDRHVEFYQDGAYNRVDRENSHAYLVDGTRCIVSQVGVYAHTGDLPSFSECVTKWKTDDEYEWEFDDYWYKINYDNNDTLGYAIAHLPFRCTIVNTRWAAFCQLR